MHSTNAGNADLPKEVRGIRVGRRADVLFFLHSTAWGSEKPFRYQVNYEDGSSVEVAVVNGRQIIDWWGDPAQFAESLARGGGFIAWQGDNPMRKGVVLPGFEWTNPQPARAIRDIDFLTVPESGYSPVPVLVAIDQRHLPHGARLPLPALRQRQPLRVRGLSGGALRRGDDQGRRLPLSRLRDRADPHLRSGDLRTGRGGREEEAALVEPRRRRRRERLERPDGEARR